MRRGSWPGAGRGARPRDGHEAGPMARGGDGQSVGKWAGPGAAGESGRDDT